MYVMLLLAPVPCPIGTTMEISLTVLSHRKRTKRKMIPEVIHCVLGARRTKREKRNRRRRWTAT